MVEKQGQKIRAGVSPPPLFGPSPKQNIFFFVRASLTVSRVYAPPHHLRWSVSNPGPQLEYWSKTAPDNHDILNIIEDLFY